MKNLSSENRKPKNEKQSTSPLSRIFVRGHKKLGYKKTTGNLIMQLSANDHKHIATLIAQWLTDDDNSPK